MTTTVLELRFLLDQQSLAKHIAERWDAWNSQREGWLNEKQELRNFLFATDTTKTSNSTLPWKNKTTLPKLCQIRDNLHANYFSAMFPNDDWLKWEGYSLEDEDRAKKEAIQAYMSNKVRESSFTSTVSQLIYDYIDYGVAFSDVVWVNEKKVTDDGEIIPGYVGPRTIRISPLDIVFDLTAIDFEHSPKITRSVKRLGEMLQLAEQDPSNEYLRGAVARSVAIRQGGWSTADWRKNSAYGVDGFGNLQEYYGTDYVELLEFEGTIHDPETGTLLDDYVITIMDRREVIRKVRQPAWKRGGYKRMSTWRKRPDNLLGMGPLDNLVGMQYRVDHLENLKADIFDLIAAPPLKIIGDVEEFDWRPFGEIHITGDGDVVPLTPPAQVLQANIEISGLLNLMEEFAGAPKQAMGIRTPGEKTAFEVQALENAAGRIFQEKVTQFELELLEPTLNNMLEVARRKMDGADVVRVMDDDLGVVQFLSITKEDITAKGKLRPIGARHFSARAQLIQNLVGVANSNVWPKIERHLSDKQLAKLVEDSLQLRRFSLVSDNVAIQERAEAARLEQEIQEQLAVEQATPLE